MAAAASITPQSFLLLSKSKSKPKPKPKFFPNPIPLRILLKPNSHIKHSSHMVRSSARELDIIPVQSSDMVKHQDGIVFVERETEAEEVVDQVLGVFPNERLSFDGGFSSAASSVSMPESVDGQMEMDKLTDRAINATIVLAAGSFAITKLLTIDHDYWHGWTLFEILRYAPQHNWSAYEEALKSNPVLAKMVISGVVYSVGDWIAQCYEGKPLFEFDRARMLRSGLVGFTLHGSLSHYYYQLCEALFPFDGWWVVPVKVAFDQTVWSAIWNSIYYTLLGFLRFESPINIFTELKATFWPMLTLFE